MCPATMLIKHVVIQMSMADWQRLVCRVTWHFPAAGFLAILSMAGLASLVWRQSSLSQLCNWLAPGQSTHIIVPQQA